MFQTVAKPIVAATEYSTCWLVALTDVRFGLLASLLRAVLRDQSVRLVLCERSVALVLIIEQSKNMLLRDGAWLVGEVLVHLARDDVGSR